MNVDLRYMHCPIFGVCANLSVHCNGYSLLSCRKFGWSQNFNRLASHLHFLKVRKILYTTVKFGAELLPDFILRKDFGRLLLSAARCSKPRTGYLNERNNHHQRGAVDSAHAAEVLHAFLLGAPAEQADEDGAL